MKIYGIGTDIVKVNRIKRLISKKRFKEKIFSKYEILRCEKKINKHNCYAKRFAAKEAFSKAIKKMANHSLKFQKKQKKKWKKS